MKKFLNLNLIFVSLIISAILLVYLPHVLAVEMHIYPSESIQSAIDGSSDGDVIIIHQGTYVENINFLGKAITLRCTTPDDPNVVTATIIDGNQIDTIIIFDHKERSSSILNGITLQNGKSYFGGGVYCSFSSPTITNCIISRNSAFNGGGGICCDYSSSPRISNCIITGNSASSTGNGYGGGIYCSYSSPTITNCTVSTNSADLGGGIYCSYSSPYIVNSIFWDNDSEIYVTQGSNTKLSYCDVQGGYPGLGNINSDPLFVDPESGDYHLKANSPCINVGNPRKYDSDSSRSDIGVYGGKGGLESEPINTIVAIDGSENFTSIQDAIDATVSGDTITVFPGTYPENLVIGGKNVSLVSQGGFGSVTIDGSGSGSGIILTNVESGTFLDGFTIQSGSSEYGGGIWCQFSSPRISNCLINDNSASWGGGIYCSFSSPSINNCTISGNSANTGGGIGCQFSSPSISNCVINDNQASWGGGIYCSFSSPGITNCTFSRNSTDIGGGIYCSSSSPSITNCILWGNSPDQISLHNSTLTITYSNIDKGYEGVGNIDTNPLFVDPNKDDFHLQSNSPCIDTGTSNEAPEKDKDDNPRPCGDRYDMGAYEFSNYCLNTFYRDADADGFGDPNVISISNDMPEGFVENADDCDDIDRYTYPNAEEICNSKDNDCNGWVDVEIRTTSTSALDNFKVGRNIVLLNTSCFSYTSIAFLSNLKKIGNIISLHHKDQHLGSFKSNYSFFNQICGEEIELSIDSNAFDGSLYIIDILSK